MIIDFISDLHGRYPKLEGGDLLVIAGDLTSKDEDSEHLYFIEWLAYEKQYEKKYKKIIYIAGNHDNFLYDKKRHGKINTPDEWGIEYLCDSGSEFEGIKIWGSPWTVKFEGMNKYCQAFTCETDEELSEKWSLIPEDTDILITHSPPFGILDKNFEGEHCGSISLRDIVLSRDRMPNLKIHCFGHIHEWGGRIVESTLTKFVNASHVNEYYRPVNKQVRIVL